MQKGWGQKETLLTCDEGAPDETVISKRDAF